MKRNLCLFSVGMMAILCCVDAVAAMPSHLYAGGITANNIAGMQRSILQTAMNNFGKYSAYRKFDYIRAAKKTASDMYGHMRVYGEYEDAEDEEESGHNGGDGIGKSKLWLSWKYYNEYLKLNNGFDKMDSVANTIMAGASTWTRSMGTIGAFVGYLGGSLNDSDVEIKENGGYFGLYNGWSYGHFDFSAIANGGSLSNTANSIKGDDKFSNLWFGIGANATYDFVIDNTFIIQPGAYIGYTWVRVPEYTSVSGEQITANSLGDFNFTPSVRFIKNIIGHWYGTANVKYVMNFDNGGIKTISGIGVEELAHDNFAEYGIGIERHVGAFDLSVNINRRDGGYTGWNGGIDIRYRF